MKQWLKHFFDQTTLETDGSSAQRPQPPSYRIVGHGSGLAPYHRKNSSTPTHSKDSDGSAL